MPMVLAFQSSNRQPRDTSVRFRASYCVELREAREMYNIR